LLNGDIINLLAYDSVKDLHGVAGTTSGENLCKDNGLLSLDIERVHLDSLFEEFQKTLGDLTGVIHGYIGGSDMDEVLHVFNKRVDFILKPSFDSL